MVKWRASGQQRGAAVFIVVLVITLLTAIGIFAAKSASLVEVAVGHNRQAVQTLYLADYGARTSLSMLSGSSGGIYIEQVRSSTDTCEVNRYAAPTAAEVAAGIQRVPCYKIMSEEVSQVAGLPVLDEQTPERAGSLGPETLALTGGLNWALTGLWVTELTEAYDGSTPERFDNDSSQFKSVRLVLTTYAQVRTGGVAWCGDLNSATTASVHAVRNHVTLPMVAR